MGDCCSFFGSKHNCYSFCSLFVSLQTEREFLDSPLISTNYLIALLSIVVGGLGYSFYRQSKKDTELEVKKKIVVAKEQEAKRKDDVVEQQIKQKRQQQQQKKKKQEETFKEQDVSEKTDPKNSSIFHLNSIATHVYF
jgi:ATPase subunit of ABC transporter with duplicated ATPase domains